MQTDGDRSVERHSVKLGVTGGAAVFDVSEENVLKNPENKAIV